MTLPFDQAAERYFTPPEDEVKGIQQGRLWAIRNGPNSPIFHAVETNLPTLFKTGKDADAFKKRLKTEYEVDVEVVEVAIIEKFYHITCRKEER